MKSLEYFVREQQKDSFGISGFSVFGGVEFVICEGIATNLQREIQVKRGKYVKITVTSSCENRTPQFLMFFKCHLVVTTDKTQDAFATINCLEALSEELEKPTVLKWKFDKTIR